MMLFLGATAVIGLVSNIALFIVDARNGGTMAKPSLKETEDEPKDN